MNGLLALFLIAALGYLVGGIRIKGIELGTAGVLLVALAFGYFGIGVEIPAIIRNIGLACFVGSEGFIAGPEFFRDFKANAASYILLGFVIILSGAATCVGVIKLFGIRAELAVGLFTGALTSTPGLAAACFFAFMLCVVLGILLGSISIPLPGGARFSLGTTGGLLIMGLIFGHFTHAGPLDLTVPVDTLKTFRELGLMLFLIGAGVEGGQGFVETLRQEGAMLFAYGAVMTLVPMVVGYLVASKLLRLRLLNNLGSITGGMTSTPALGTLIAVARTDDVASAYAATYSIALVTVVLCSQFIVVLFGR